jgi:hypothetical protein
MLVVAREADAGRDDAGEGSIPLGFRLIARGPEVQDGGARIHRPDAAALVVIRQV